MVGGMGWWLAAAAVVVLFVVFEAPKNATAHLSGPDPKNTAQHNFAYQSYF